MFRYNFTRKQVLCSTMRTFEQFIDVRYRINIFVVGVV